MHTFVKGMAQVLMRLSLIVLLIASSMSFSSFESKSVLLFSYESFSKTAVLMDLELGGANRRHFTDT